MRKKITLLIITLFLTNINGVKAFTIIPNDNRTLTIGEVDSSASSSSVINANACNDRSNYVKASGLGSSDIKLTTHKKITTTTCTTPSAPVPSSKKFNVVIMVDSTGSMDNDKDRVPDTNASIKKIIEALKSKAPDSKVKLYKFNANDGTGFGVFDEKSVNLNYNSNYLNINDAHGNTNLQLAYRKAYKILKDASARDKKSYIPMVIIITDGYPTDRCSGKYYDVSDKCSGYDKKGEWYPEQSSRPYLAYTTARTLHTLKKNLVENSGYTYKNYSKVITIGFGMNNSDEYVRFILNPNQSTYGNLNKKTSDLWTYASKYLYDYMDKGKHDSVNLQRCRNGPELGLFKSGTYTTKAGGGASGCGGYDSYSVSFPDITTNKNWLNSYNVDKSLIEPSARTIKTKIKNLIESTIDSTVIEQEPTTCASTTKGDTKTNTYKINYSTVKYTKNAKNININIKNNFPALYYHVPSSIKVLKSDNSATTINNLSFRETVSSKAKSCVAIDSIVYPLVIYENSTVDFGIDNTKKILYKGSGFELDKARVVNTVGFDYGSNSNNKLNFNIEFAKNYYLMYGTANDYGVVHEGSNEYLTGLQNVNINDIYLDENCSQRLQESNFSDANIWNKIDIKKLPSEIIKSVDSNNPKGGNVFLSTTNYQNVSISGKTKTIINNIKLNKPCISTIDTKVNNVIVTNGTIIYMSSPNSSCPDSFNNGYNEKGNNLHYVPVDYGSDNVPVFSSNVNLSSYEGITINYSLECPKIAFKDDRKLKEKFRYRVIDLGDPFPKANGNINNVPINWKDWYSVQGNKRRLANTYDRDIIYQVNVSKDSILDFIKDNDTYYTRWSGMNEDGTSNFVSNFNVKINNNFGYCKLGEFSTNCDKY